MADSITRKINIWINGKEVENTYQSISNAIRQAGNELAHMTIGSKEYIAQTQKIKQLKGVLEEHRKAQGMVAQGWTKISGAIKQIAFGNIISNLVSQIGLTLTGAFTKLTTAVSDFEGGMTNVFTQMDDASIEQFGENMKEGAKQVSELGFAMNDVTKSLFDAVSAGIDAGESIEFMNEAAVLAKGGVTSLSTSVDGLTTIINAYDLEIEDARKVSESFFTTSKFGKTTVDEIASSIGKAAPIAKSLGVSYQELMSAGSALTLSGIQTKEAFNYLKAAFSNLMKPSADAEEILRKFGIPMGATQIKAVGFTKTLELLNKVIQEHPDEIARAIPSIEGLTAIQALSGKGLERYNEILQATMTDTGANSSLQKAYAKQMESFPNIMAAAREKLNTFAITLGEKLAPYIKEIVPIIGGWTKKVIELFGWIERNSGVLKILSKWIALTGASILTYNIYQKAKVAWDKLELLWTERKIVAQKLWNTVLKAAPWAIAIAGITALVSGIINLVKYYREGTLAQKTLNEANIKARELMVEDTRNINKYLEKARDMNITQEERKKLISDINTQYGQYLPKLLTENSSYQDIATSLGIVNDQLLKKYELQALEEKAVELQKRKIDLEDKLSKTTKINVGWLQKAADYSDKIVGTLTGARLIKKSGLFGEQLSVTEMRDEISDIDNATKEIEARITNLQNKSNSFDHKIAPADAATYDSELALLKKNLDNKIITYKQFLAQKKELDIKYGKISLASGEDEKELEKKEKEEKKQLEEYKKNYEQMTKAIADLRKKAYNETLTDDEKEIQEVADKYDEQLQLVQGYIDELEAKNRSKEGLKADEMELLKKFYEQQYQLIEMSETEIANKIKEINERKLEVKKEQLNKFTKAFGEAAKSIGNARQDEWDKTKKKIEDIIKYASLAKDAISAVFEIQSNRQAEELAQYEAGSQKKKEMLDDRLKKGLISEDNYNKQVAQLDKNLEKEKKTFAIEEAKRQRKMRIFETILNTAAAVVEALPNIPLSIAVGVLGGIQLAAIASQPIPKMGKGARVNQPTFAQIGEAGPEIVLSNSIVGDKTYGPLADDLARIQEGKKPRFLGQPAVPNFSGMNSAIGRSQVTSIQNTNTVINQVDNKSIDQMKEQIMQMTGRITEMTKTVEKIKYLRAIITQDDLTEHEEDEKIRIRYSNF